MYKLTKAQAESLFGIEYMPDSYFNPIQDGAGNWVISAEEVSQCINPSCKWVQGLDQINYIPIEQ